MKRSSQSKQKHDPRAETKRRDDWVIICIYNGIDACPGWQDAITITDEVEQFGFTYLLEKSHYCVLWDLSYDPILSLL